MPSLVVSMLSILLKPLRWVLRLLLYVIAAVLLLLGLLPFMFDLPVQASQVLAALNAGGLRNMHIQMEPAGGTTYPPMVRFRDLRITNGANGATALAAAGATVGVDILQSLTQRQVVMAARIDNPVIYADQPLDLGAISTAVTESTGFPFHIMLIGGELINPVSGTMVALGSSLIMVPPVMMPGVPGLPGMAVADSGTGMVPGNPTGVPLPGATAGPGAAPSPGMPANGGGTGSGPSVPVVNIPTGVPSVPTSPPITPGGYTPLGPDPGGVLVPAGSGGQVPPGGGGGGGPVGPSGPGGDYTPVGPGSGPGGGGAPVPGGSGGSVPPGGGGGVAPVGPSVPGGGYTPVDPGSGPGGGGAPVPGGSGGSVPPGGGGGGAPVGPSVPGGGYTPVGPGSGSGSGGSGGPPAMCTCPCGF